MGFTEEQKRRIARAQIYAALEDAMVRLGGAMMKTGQVFRSSLQAVVDRLKDEMIDDN